MKNLKTKIFAAAIVLLMMVGANTYAQVRIGGGLAYATDFNEVGLNLRGDYLITEPWRVGADFTFYFTGEGYSYNELNFNGFYVFEGESITPYVLGGINIFMTSVNYGGFKASGSDIGLNLGGGLDLPFSDNLSGFGEAKIVLTGITYLALNVGIKYAF